MKRFVSLLASACILLFSSTGAYAGAIGFTFTGGDDQSGQNYTYGFQFTPVNNIYIDGLGFFDQDSDGLAVPHRVGIWNSAGVLLASTTVSTDNSTLEGATINGGQFRFAPIGDLLLLKGVTYTLGASEEGSPDVWYAFDITQIGNPALADVSAIGYYVLSSFEMPTLTIENTYGIGSFTARVAAVPEPDSLALLGVCVAGLAFTRRRKK